MGRRPLSRWGGDRYGGGRSEWQSGILGSASNNAALSPTAKNSSAVQETVFSRYNGDLIMGPCKILGYHSVAMFQGFQGRL